MSHLRIKRGDLVVVETYHGLVEHVAGDAAAVDVFLCNGTRVTVPPTAATIVPIGVDGDAPANFAEVMRPEGASDLTLAVGGTMITVAQLARRVEDLEAKFAAADKEHNHAGQMMLDQVMTLTERHKDLERRQREGFAALQDAGQRRDEHIVDVTQKLITLSSDAKRTSQARASWAQAIGETLEVVDTRLNELEAWRRRAVALAAVAGVRLDGSDGGEPRPLEEEG